MLGKAWSAAIHGVEVLTVEVEVNPDGGGPEDIMMVVGMPDAAVRESRDRVKSAMLANRFYPPSGKTTVNLAPADVRKEGAAFDLPIALCILSAQGEISRDVLQECMVMGELALDGKVRSVNGALPVAMHARDVGFKRILVPAKNAEEAAVTEGIEVYGVENLMEAVRFLAGELTEKQPVRLDMNEVMRNEMRNLPDFRDVKGQESAKRALEIAAAGGHNVLMIGSPGTGKTMLATRLASILPPLTLDEALEVTKVHSIAGVLRSSSPLVIARPFRAPHHTISDAGLLGGQSVPRPGEISLAHNGVIFLDELPEFRRNVLEVLRQPLESGDVTISRASGSYRFPADFVLVAAMNPCPCGYHGSAQRECRCSSNQVYRYRSRISGPLLDRIDIHVEVSPLSDHELTSAPTGETSEEVLGRVLPARKRQQTRFDQDVRWNGRMQAKHIEKHCVLSKECKAMLRSAIGELNLTARAYDRILRVARTIADLENEDSIQIHHLSEAIHYRVLDRQNW